MTEESTAEDTLIEAEYIELTGDEIAAKLVKLFVTHMQHLPDVWQKMSQAQQDTVLDAIKSGVRAEIEDAVQIIASDRRPSLHAVLEQVVVKDGIKATLTMGKKDPSRFDLVDAQGQDVLLVVVNAEQFTQGMEKVRGETDQRALELQ